MKTQDSPHASIRGRASILSQVTDGLADCASLMGGTITTQLTLQLEPRRSYRAGSFRANVILFKRHGEKRHVYFYRHVDGWRELHKAYLCEKRQHQYKEHAGGGILHGKEDRYV